MRMKSLERVGLASTLLLCAVALASMGLTQNQKFGTVKGKITAPDGQPVSNAVVRLVVSGPQRAGADTSGSSRDKSTGISILQPVQYGRGETVVKVGKTDDAGYYELKQVPVGKYSLMTNLTPRFKAGKVAVEVTENQATSADLKLEPR